MDKPSDHKADTCSSTKHQIVKFTHRWEIENINFYFKSTRPEDGQRCQRIQSPKFSPPNDPTLQFQLLLYPKGESEASKGHISIFLCLSSCAKPEVKAQWKVSIIDQQNIKQNTSTILENFKPNGVGWGNPIFVTHGKLNGLLIDNKLIIFSDIEVMIDSFGWTKVDTRIKSKFLDNFAAIFESKKLSDVVLIAEDSTEHRAHRAILAARSPVFGAMFEHDTEERKKGRVLIDDIEGDVIEEMLRFIYTGKVLKLDELADRLLIAADKYELDQLKDICEKYIIDNLNTENVLAMLIIADRHSSPLLRSKSIEYINANLPSLTENGNWQAVKDKPELYFELLSKAATENQLTNQQAANPQQSSKCWKIFKYVLIFWFGIGMLGAIIENAILNGKSRKCRGF